MRALVALLCSGCCVETVQIVLDTSRQPLAELSLGGETITGTLETNESGRGFETTLRTADDAFYTLRLPTAIVGPHTATLSNRDDVMDVMVEIDVSITEVCIPPDQNDSGANRCRNGYTGTIELLGPDATGTWLLDQEAVIAPGDPDC